MTNRVVPDRQGVINIGKLKENLVTEVALPAPGFEGGSYVVLLRRPKEELPYPVSARHDGSSLVWTVQTADTAIAGTGKLECRWYGDNGEVAKSQTYMVRIADGLPDPTEAPEAWAGFMQQVSQDAGRAESAADNAAKTLKKLEDGIASGDFRGEKGEKGDPGPQGPKGEAGPAGDTTAADAAAEAAKQAAQEAQKAAEASAGSAAQAAESVGGLADDLEATQKDIAKMKRAIKFQAELNKGQTWDFEVDTQEAYQRIVPSGAKAGAVMEWGGKTVAWNQLASIKTAASTEMNFLNVKIPTSAFRLKHKYYFSDVANESDGTDFTFSTVGFWNATMDKYVRLETTPIRKNGKSAIVASWTALPEGTSENDLTNIVFQYIGANSAEDSRVLAEELTCIDLTLLFGPGNEPTDTSDPRIAQIEAYAAAHPEYASGELVNALVDEVRVANAAGDSTATHPIPDAVRSLPGYGWSAGNVANTVERTENGWQYVQRVGSVDLGTLRWSPQKISIDAYRYQITLPLMLSNTKNIVTAAYSYVGGGTWTGEIGIGTYYSIIQIFDSAYSDGTAESLAAFKAHITGVPLYYELATPITTDITALMGDALAPFAVEAGGSITLHHPKADEGFAIDVPAKIQYITKLSEVSANG